MNLKMFVWITALSAGAMLSTAHAASYVSDGMSFASSISDSNVGRATSNSFEVFSSNALADRQQTMLLFDSSPDNALQAISSSGASATSNLDAWLMLLIGGGLVALQLRRKQKSLPHQPLASVATE